MKRYIVLLLLLITQTCYGFGLWDTASLFGEGGAVPLPGIQSQTMFAGYDGSLPAGQSYSRASTVNIKDYVGNIISIPIDAPEFEGLPWDGTKFLSYYVHTVSCWGDSLTEGIGALSTPYPLILSTLVPGVTVINNGLGGDTAAQILTRLQAAPTQHGNTTIIWAGQNGYTSLDPALIRASINSMVADLTTTNYLVLSVIGTVGDTTGSSGALSRDTLNAGLLTDHGDHYLNVLAPLQASNGATDAAYRSDGQHLNEAGYTIVAQMVKTKLDSLGYSVQIPLVSAGMTSHPAGTNLVRDSTDIIKTTWAVTNGAVKTDAKNVSLAAGIFAGIQTSVTTSPSIGDSHTFSAKLSGSGTIRIGYTTVGGTLESSSAGPYTLTATPTLYSISKTWANAGHTQLTLVVSRYGETTATAVTIEESQIEPGLVAGPRVLTNGAASTVAATVVSQPTGGIITVGGTVQGWVQFNGVNTGVVQTIWSGGYVDADNFTSVQYIHGTGFTVTKRVAGVTTTVTHSQAAIVGTPYLITMPINSNNTLDLFVNGTQAGTNTTSTTGVPVIDATMQIGSHNSATQANGALKNFRFFSTPLTLAQHQVYYSRRK